jgi:hypothetical protein
MLIGSNVKTLYPSFSIGMQNNPQLPPTSIIDLSLDTFLAK